MAAITIRKPVAVRDRCGVRIAENSVGSAAISLPELITLHYTSIMAPRATPKKRAAKPARGGIKPARALPTKRKAAKPKRWTPAAVDEAVTRLAKVNPEPRGELEHVDPYTLLIAVVLSAQATDAGVNKATPALFAAADTPAKMIALGEDKVRDFIKSIGLYRTKAKNVVALSQL